MTKAQQERKEKETTTATTTREVKCVVGRAHRCAYPSFIALCVSCRLAVNDIEWPLYIISYR
jgi:hypothetical protein